METWLRLHRNAFAFFEGVPKRVVVDNLKAAIVRAVWDDPQVQQSYRECAEHYGFLIAPCRPRTPRHKGKVEQGGVHYVKRNFLGGRQPITLTQANQDVLVWCNTTAGLRIHGTTKEQPLVRFQQTEQARLQSLPETPYDMAVWKKLKLNRDCYVEFDRAYYSAPYRLVGQELWVCGSIQQVRIYSLDHHEHGCTTLIVEVMGRHSNIVLVDAGGIVMECVKRIGPEMSRYRTLLPGQPYLPPPPQEKLAPGDLTEFRLRYIVEALPFDVPLWRGLVQGLKGVSPLLAQEMAFRATGRTDTLAGEVEKMSPLLAAIGDLLSPLESGHWQPSVVREEGEIAVFAPYLLTHRQGHEPLASISQAVEGYYAGAVGDEPYGFLRQSLRQAIARGRERQQKKQRALERSLATGEETETLRQKGELILAYATQIAPGQTELAVELEPGQPSLTIALDPRSSPVENAQQYFKAYRKAKAGAEGIPALLERVELELRYLDQLEADLELASTQPEVQEVRIALSEAGYVKGEGRRRKPPCSQPLTFRSPDGLTILVGKNSRQNEEVTFRRASADDLWLHARGVPGAHVIIRSGGQKVPEATLRQAAELAAYYSQAREATRVAVDYTQRRHVRRIKGARPGLVTYDHEQTIHVTPRGPESVRFG